MSVNVSRGLGSMVEVISTSATEAADTAEAWEQCVLETCGAMQVIPGRGFTEGVITSTTLGAMRVAVVRADPHSVIRRPSFASSEGGHVYVATVVRGHCMVRQDDVELMLGPGDVAAFDSSRPYSMQMDQPFELISVRAPHDVLGLNQRTTQLVTGTVWRGTSGVGALVRHTLNSIGQLPSGMDAAVSEPLASALNGVVSALFAERLSNTSAVDSAASRQLLLLRIRRYAERHLDDPDLTPTALARRYHISLRYLQMLFAEQGTSPARWIRDERLAQLRVDLADPRLNHISVATLGERRGLVDPSQVSRLFRLKYGQTPSGFRRSQARHLATAA